MNNKLVNKEKVSNKKDNYQTTASNSYNNNNHYSDLECHTKMTFHSISCTQTSIFQNKFYVQELALDLFSIQQVVPCCKPCSITNGMLHKHNKWNVT